MANIALSAQKRDLFGKKTKVLRHKNLIPANVFGKKVKSQAITVAFADFKKTFKEAGETSIIDLSIEGEAKTRPVLISQTQADPVTKTVLHVDFRQVDLTEKIIAPIPLELVGEAPAVSAGAIIVNLRDEIEVEALPSDLPEKIEIDISGIKEVGDSISVADIKVSSKVEIQLEKEELLVQAQEAQKEEVEEEAPVEAGDVEATAEKGEQEEGAEEGGKEEDKKEEKKEE